MKRLKNKPSEPIVTRERGTRFYCRMCEKTYQKCKCKVYVSMDTIGQGITTMFRSSTEAS